MQDDHEIKKLLRSIKNALWIIAAILLMGLGFILPDFRRTPFAEIIMLLGFWGGFFLFVCTLTGLILGIFSQPKGQNTQAEQDGTSNGG
jgi:F0F1-type ATP synthase assembly protein I